jgi:hypothetical protein
MPELSVTDVTADRFAEAPVAGTMKTTVAPVTGLPAESLTWTASAAGKGELTAVLCTEPPVMVRVPGGAAEFVSTKAADAVLPFTEIEAVTL